MIDFRYHLVSLISVFLALAVGIALGAGPLKETIGDTLTGQVEQLRLEKDALRAELDTTAGDLQQADSALASVSPALLDGLLAERRVAVVQLGEVQDAVTAEVLSRLDQAGASVVAQVAVTAAWTDPERVSFRESLAGTLVGYLEPAPEADAGTGTELAEALAQALTSAAPGDPDTLSENASVVLDLLSGDAGLVTVEGEVTVPADAVVVLAGPVLTLVEAAEQDAAQASQDPEEATAAADLLAAQTQVATQVATAVQARSSGAVVAGGDVVDSGVLAALRAGDDTATEVSTVEAVQTVAGQVAVPMALAARIHGTVGHYGPSPDATSPMPPRVVLPPVVRTAPEATPTEGVPAEGTTTDGAPADGSATDGAGEG